MPFIAGLPVSHPFCRQMNKRLDAKPPSSSESGAICMKTPQRNARRVSAPFC